MPSDFEKKLGKYADLIVHVGLNLQEGQRLAIDGKNLSRGAPLASAPLVRKVAESAYKAGARYVNVLWDDDQQHLIRLAHASKDSLDEYPSWRTKSLLEYAENADAIFTIFAENPDLYAGQDPALATNLLHVMERNLQPKTNLQMKSAYAWTLVSVPTVGWAKKVFPDLGADEAMAKLWEVVFILCRLENDDPVAAWKEHIANLKMRSDYLNEKAYDALKYSGPGTDLIIFSALYFAPYYLFSKDRLRLSAVFSLAAIILTFLAGLSIGGYYLPAAGALLLSFIILGINRLRQR